MDNKMISKIINILAVISISLGAIGMLFSLIFLFSNNLADLVGAGFPFVAGAILFGSGLIALTNNNKK